MKCSELILFVRKRLKMTRWRKSPELLAERYKIRFRIWCNHWIKIELSYNFHFILCLKNFNKSSLRKVVVKWKLLFRISCVVSSCRLTIYTFLSRTTKLVKKYFEKNLGSQKKFRLLLRASRTCSRVEKGYVDIK